MGRKCGGVCECVLVSAVLYPIDVAQWDRFKRRQTEPPKGLRWRYSVTGSTVNMFRMFFCILIANRLEVKSQARATHML